nr:TPA: cytochrome c oxidase subunit III [Bdellodrilus illuminatus]
MNRSPFHLVELSPWPVTSSISALCLTLGLVSWFHGYSVLILLMSFFMMILSMYQWWRDISREGVFKGAHMHKVVSGLSMGMILFITYEVWFFITFFWAYFHMSYQPATELGAKWPPIGMDILNPFSIPLLNTAVLLASGMTITWAHHSMINKDKFNFSLALSMTIMLGLYFTILQLSEYNLASFSISDSVYGTTFYVTTGFHGAHVLIGTMFLVTCFLRSLSQQYSSNHHFGFMAAAWYWHFVDVIWICLFTSMYWWGS